jgi:inner membrane protein
VFDFDYYTHIFLGILVGFGVDKFLVDFNNIERLIYYSFIIFSSVLPDIDTPKSFLGSRVKILSVVIYNVFGHRGIMHNFGTAVIVFLLSVFVYGLNIINISIFIGYFTHILGDKISDRYSYVFKFDLRKI